MRILIILAITLGHFVARASEIEMVEFQSDFKVVRCDFSLGAQCNSPLMNLINTQILLAPDTQTGYPTGSTQIHVESDGYRLEAVLTVMKVQVDGAPLYHFQSQINVYTISDFSLIHNDFLGSVSVRDPSALNRVSWFGAPFKDKKLTLTPRVVLAAPEIEQ
jgi:hypothetical protein